MVDDVLQCCYTNAASGVGGVQASGWRTVACSEDMPPDALEGCTRFQVGNSYIRRDMLDEDGNDLNLLEIAGDGKYLYVIRTQYGLFDAVGRRNMFSHAYIFPWNDRMLRDSNIFLTLRESNFAEKTEDAEKRRQALTRNKRFNVQDALQIAGIDMPDVLAALIDAVYEQVTNQSVFEPLFVQYDGTPRQLAAILYCIYTYLPFHIRKLLVSASAEANNALHTNVVFSRDASRHGFHFDFAANVANVLSEARRSAIGRLGFVDYAARNMFGSNPSEYFEKLERVAKSLNATSNAPAQISLLYKIAHLLVTNESVADYDDGSLDRSLDDALRLRSRGSDHLNKHIASILNEFMKPGRRLELDDATEKDLYQKLEDEHSKELENAVEHYDMHRLEQLSSQDASDKLAQIEAKSKKMFTRYEASLTKKPWGKEILDYYYAHEVQSLDAPSWSLLADYCTRSARLGKAKKTTDAVRDRAWELYSSSLDDIKEVPAAKDEYLKIMGALPTSGENSMYEKRALGEFWERVNPATVLIDYARVYKAMDDKSDKARSILNVLDMQVALGSGDTEEFLRLFHEYCDWLSLSVRNRDSKDTREQVVERFRNDVNQLYKGGDAHLKERPDSVSMIKNEDVLGELLRLSAALCMPDRDENSYTELDGCSQDPGEHTEKGTHKRENQQESFNLSQESGDYSDQNPYMASEHKGIFKRILMALKKRFSGGGRDEG